MMGITYTPSEYSLVAKIFKSSGANSIKMQQGIRYTTNVIKEILFTDFSCWMFSFSNTYGVSDPFKAVHTIVITVEIVNDRP